ncbi:MAG: NADH-quinone oxidoreductase subunit N [Candidatus Micrarchaeia archaeon]
MIILYFLIILFGAVLFGNIISSIFFNKKTYLIVSVFLFALTSISLIYLYLSGINYNYLSIFSINPFSEFFIAIFSAGAILISSLYYEFEDNYNEFSLLLSFSFIGMCIVVLSTSIPGIFIGLELISIPTVFSIFLSRKSLEAGTKLFIMAAISIAIFSFAMALSYGGNNTVLLVEGQSTSIMIMAAVLFIIGLGFEASIFPFNVLIPDVYEGSPGYVTALMGSMNKKAGLAALIQILLLMFITIHSAFYVVAILSVFTMFYGNIGALMQKNIKRIMAYSSISQAGYILIGIATATAYGISGSLFQIFAHMFIFIGIMAIIVIFEKHNKTTIDNVVGMYDQNKFLAIALTIFMLSLVGLPLTTGFVGKFLIFLSAISAGLAILTFFGILNSIISLYYYLKIILSMYSEGNKKRIFVIDKASLTVIAVCLIITIIFGIYPQPIMSFINSASSYLIGLT